MLPNPETTVLNAFSVEEDTRYIAPMERNEEHVVPFRALRKNPEDPQYYEYGKECYMAELVDIAQHLDAIDEKRGVGDDALELGGVRVGEHTVRLLNDLQYSTEGSMDATALAIEQVMFMNGRKVVGGREALNEALQQKEGHWAERVEEMEYEQEFTESGKPQSRPPLTCYYEWFQRFARPVSIEEMEARNLAI